MQISHLNANSWTQKQSSISCPTPVMLHNNKQQQSIAKKNSSWEGTKVEVWGNVQKEL